jgi:hypothetical protein
MPTQTTYPIKVYFKSAMEVEKVRLRAATTGRSGSAYLRDLAIIDLAAAELPTRSILKLPDPTPEEIHQLEQAAEPIPEKPQPTIEDFKKILGEI